MARSDRRAGESLERLLERLRGMRDLRGRGLLDDDLMGSQLLDLVRSSDATTWWLETIEPDLKARRLLCRMEDPDAWRRDGSLPPGERLPALRRRLIELVDGLPDAEPRALLERLLEASSLPHFASLVSRGRRPGRPRGHGDAELSVLD